MAYDIEPDIEHARLFLSRLEPDADSFTFQIFPERQGDDGEKVRPAIFHGSLDDCAEQLVQANRNGAGVFFMVNAGDQKGRKNENVTRIRAQFVDLDKPGVDPLFGAEMPPHLVVESSPGKWHAYWLCKDGRLDQFTLVQMALAVRFGGDPAVSDLARVMRLPGFYHMKEGREPFMTRMHKGKEA